MTLTKGLSLSVLRIRDFRLLFLTRMLVMMSLQAQAVIVGWQIYSLTKDPFLLGLAGLAEALPALACAFFAGHIVDNGQPRRIYAFCASILALNIYILLLLSRHADLLPDKVFIISLFVGVFISGAARSFIMPSAFSLLSRVVSRNEIPSAMAWLSSAAQTALIGGPALAGLLYGGYGAAGAWALPAFLITLSLITVCSLRVRHVRDEKEREPFLKNVLAGWNFVMKTPVLLSVMALDMFAVLFGGAIAMLPAYAGEVLHVGSEGLGFLRACPAIGSVSMALLLALRPSRYIRGIRLLWAVSGFGLCMIGFGLSTSFWLSCLFLIVSGIFDSISILVRGTLMQLLTPENMRGRVSAISSMFIISSNEIGAFESGVAARLMGLVPSVVFGGVATLLVVITTALKSPHLRKTVVDTHKAE